MKRSVALVLLLVLGSAAAVRAQCADADIREGILAYQELRLEQAAQLLRGALDRPVPGARGDCLGREAALAFLGAVELYRGNDEAASDAFRRLALTDPRYHPDSIAFAPRVTEAFRRARSRTRAVDVAIPERAEIRVGLDSLSVRVYSTSDRPVIVSVERAGATEPRTLYLGPGSDSMTIGWDGKGADGLPVAEGEYLLRAAPLDTAGAEVRSVRVPLRVEHISGIMPTRRSSEPTPSWNAALSLGGALIAGAAVVILPRMIGSGGGASWRYAVAGAMAASGVAGVAWGAMSRPGPWPRIRIRRDEVSATDAPGGGGPP